MFYLLIIFSFSFFWFLLILPFSLTLDPTVRLSMGAVLLGGTLHKIQSSDVNQVSIQRFLSLPNMQKVKQCMFLFTSLLMILLFCCCYMGLLTYATYYNCDPLSTKVLVSLVYILSKQRIIFNFKFSWLKQMTNCRQC